MCLVWGLTFMPVKVASAHVPPVFLAAARFLIAGGLMMLWAGRDLGRVPRDAWPRLLLTALLLNTGNYAFLFWGTAQAPSGLAAIVNFATIPLFSILAVRLIEKQPISARQLISIALGTTGLLFLFWTRAAGGLDAASGHSRELLGMGSVAIGTFLYCFGAVLARPIAQRIPTLALAGWQTVIGGFGLVLVSACFETVTPAHFAALVGWPVAPALAALVVGGSLIGFTIYLRLVRDWGAFRAGLYAFVSPAIAVSAGLVVLGEPFGWAEAVGGLLMFAAAAIAIKR